MFTKNVMVKWMINLFDIQNICLKVKFDHVNLIKFKRDIIYDMRGLIVKSMEVEGGKEEGP